MRVLTLVVCALFLAAGTAGGEIVLNELMADPSKDWDGDSVYSYRDDEWVEIVNTGSVSLSLEGYRIATADTAWRFEFEGVANPGEHIVVFGSESYAWEKENGYAAYGFRMGNTGGLVQLWRVTGIDTVLVDQIAYGPSHVRDDCSYGRRPDAAGGWEVFDGLNPMKQGGNGCVPSPGGANHCDSAARSVTWGELKLLFARR